MGVTLPLSAANKKNDFTIDSAEDAAAYKVMMEMDPKDQAKFKKDYLKKKREQAKAQAEVKKKEKLNQGKLKKSAPAQEPLSMQELEKKLEKSPDQMKAELEAAKLAHPEKPSPTLEQTFIENNIRFSNWLANAAQGIDLYVVGEKISTQRNMTRANIENTTISREGHVFSNKTDFNVSPRFPNLEKYWSVKFTSYDERQDKRGFNNTYLRQTQREKDFGATIGVIRKLKNVKTSFQPRIELRDPLKISHSLAFESVAEMKNYNINPKVELFATPTKGTGVFYSLDLNWMLTKISTLTMINEGQYEENMNFYRQTHGVSVSRAFGDNSTLGTGLIFGFDNRPNFQLASYTYSVSWNQIVYERIFDYQIVPNLTFARQYGYKGIAGFMFRFAIRF